MAVFVGLDCGGSSCRALAFDVSGPSFRGQAGPANIASTPPEQLAANLAQALRGCPPATAVCGAFAGLLTEGDQTRAKQLLSTLCQGAFIYVVPDYYAALAASPPGTDICVIAGTGSLICSRRVDGGGEGYEVAKTGGRGFLLGDRGSAFQYGRAYLLQVLDSGDLPDGAIEEVFGASDEASIIASLYLGGPMAARLARLAPAFADTVRAGTPISLEFLNAETGALVNQLVRHAERYHPNAGQLTICLGGGLWKVSSIFKKALVSQLQEKMPATSCRVCELSRAPVEGAAQIARDRFLNEH